MNNRKRRAGRYQNPMSPFDLHCTVMPRMEYEQNTYLPIMPNVLQVSARRQDPHLARSSGDLEDDLAAIVTEFLLMNLPHALSKAATKPTS